MCVDATREPDGEGLILGRLVNHGTKRQQNAHVKVLQIDTQPTLCLFALRNISPGQEILYDYGISEKDLPWNQLQPDTHAAGDSAADGHMKCPAETQASGDSAADGHLECPAETQASGDSAADGHMECPAETQASGDSAADGHMECPAETQASGDSAADGHMKCPAETQASGDSAADGHMKCPAETQASGDSAADGHMECPAETQASGDSAADGHMKCPAETQASGDSAADGHMKCPAETQASGDSAADGHMKCPAETQASGDSAADGHMECPAETQASGDSAADGHMECPAETQASGDSAADGHMECPAETQASGDSAADGHLECPAETQASGDSAADGHLECPAETQASGDSAADGHMKCPAETQASGDSAADGHMECPAETQASGDSAADGHMKSLIDTRATGDTAVYGHLDYPADTQASRDSAANGDVLLIDTWVNRNFTADGHMEYCADAQATKDSVASDKRECPADVSPNKSYVEDSDTSSEISFIIPLPCNSRKPLMETSNRATVPVFLYNETYLNSSCSTPQELGTEVAHADMAMSPAADGVAQFVSCDVMSLLASMQNDSAGDCQHLISVSGENTACDDNNSQANGDSSKLVDSCVLQNCPNGKGERASSTAHIESGIASHASARNSPSSCLPVTDRACPVGSCLDGSTVPDENSSDGHGDGNTPDGSDESLCVSDDDMHFSDESKIPPDRDTIYFPPVSRSKETKQRVYNKRQACFFCSKLVTKISKHLLHAHKDEEEVKRIASMEVKTTERAKAFELLRNRGNYYHNKMVKELKQGELIMVRRPSDDGSDSTDYGPCPDCLGFYRISDFRKHMKYYCIAKESEIDTEDSFRNVKLESCLLMNDFAEASPLVKTVLVGMKQDKISQVVKQDPLIIQLGNAHSRTFGMDPQRRRHYVAQEMRLVARLMINLHEITQSNALVDDFIEPQKFDTVVRGVRLTSGQTDEIERPSVALKLGHTLSKLAAIKRCSALRRGDKKAEQEAKCFLKLKEAEWAEQISSEVLGKISQRKYNKVTELPESDDVKMFTSFLQENIEKATVNLEQRASAVNFRRCSELVLARLTTFNKRRTGETEQLALKSYTSRPNWDAASISDIKQYLTPLERHLMQELDMVYTRGKRGRKVPILIPAETKAAMDQLTTCRDVCGVPKENPYFFARPGCNTNLRACDSLRELTKEANLQKPHLIRTTKMRKYTATVSQILNLKDSQLDWLADHLGHSINVHRDYYRLSAPTIELTKVAKLMLAIDSGNVGKFVGKSLDEIDLDDIPVPDMDSDTEEAQVGTSEAAAGSTTHTRKKRGTGDVTDVRASAVSSPMQSPEPGPRPTGESNAAGSTTHTRKKQRTGDVTDVRASAVSSPMQSPEPGPRPTGKSNGTAPKSRRPWSKSETSAVWTGLHEIIKCHRVPGKSECEACMEKMHPALNQRSWRDVKYKVKTILCGIERDKEKN
ncbi:uncharacterized protein LOC119741677 isoform X2 [Patiria miniata]|uniref:SET domain-containing protein n=2 Tax=Patiria miniata TaxID=46514 RepID=A0A914BC96_PATMI|nr:uncharacterized protein LOC119741677 isoform X2 [Patiria miniata]